MSLKSAQFLLLLAAFEMSTHIPLFRVSERFEDLGHQVPCLYDVRTGEERMTISTFILFPHGRAGLALPDEAECTLLNPDWLLQLLKQISVPSVSFGAKRGLLMPQ